MARLGNKALDNRMDRIAELEAVMSGIKDEIDALKAEVKDEMDARGVSDVVTGKWKIYFSMVSSERLDTKAFKKAHLDLWKKFAKTSVTMRFSKYLLPDLNKAG